MAEDGLSRLRGGGQTVNEWGTNKRMWTVDGGGRRVGFRDFGEEGRPSTNGERINECGRRTADGGGWAFEASGRRADRQRMRNDGGPRIRPSTNGERINECGRRTTDRGRRRAGQTVDGGGRLSRLAEEGGQLLSRSSKIEVTAQPWIKTLCMSWEERSLRPVNPQAVHLACS
jgi:hypothetical protein